jgi:hypothetical protein
MLGKCSTTELHPQPVVGVGALRGLHGKDKGEASDFGCDSA